MRYAACGVVPEKLEPHGGVFRIRRFHIECGFEELRRTVARGFSQAFERQRFEPSCNAHVVDGASKIGCSIDERSVKIEKEKAGLHDLPIKESPCLKTGALLRSAYRCIGHLRKIT